MGYHLTIQFDSFELADTTDSIILVEFYKNADWLENVNDLKSRTRNLLKYDLDSTKFELSEGASFIGSSPKTITPPTIMLKINMRRNFGTGETIDYVKVIPIVFDTPLKNFAQVSLTNINIGAYLKIPSEQIAIRVLSSDSFEIVSQNSLIRKPEINTLVKFD